MAAQNQWIIHLASWFLVSVSFAEVLAPKDVPQHPGLSQQSGMHFDSYNSSVTDWPLPNNEPVIVHQKPGLGSWPLPRLCLNFMPDDAGNLLGFCSQARGSQGFDFYVTLFDAETYAILHKIPYAYVPIKNLMTKDLPLNVAYFLMDRAGRMIVADADNRVLFIKARERRLEIVKTIDLKSAVPRGHQIAQVYPDFHGGYWLMDLGRNRDPDPRPAAIGYMNEQGILLAWLMLSGEIIENGMAVDESGVYLVTDHHAYQFHYDDGIKPGFRYGYDRASHPKPGTISREGSGSTPTLIGQDLLAFTDNADHQINLVVLDRRSQIPDDQRLVCKFPLFEPERSANENSVIGYGNAIIVQNWYNAPRLFDNLRGMEPGIMRIDVADDRSSCSLVWYNREVAATATIRLGTQTGLVYASSQDLSKVREDYGIVALDFATGKLVHRWSLGMGPEHRFVSSPLAVGQNGDLIQPVYHGFDVVRAALSSQGRTMCLL